MENKPLDIENYLDHNIVDLAKNQNQSASEFLSVNQLMKKNLISRSK